MSARRTSVRPAAVAGSFYPAEPALLARQVSDHLGAARAAPMTFAPKALVAPHAGYRYSGPVAGSAFRPLAEKRDAIRRVVLLGPSHFVPLRGAALPSVESFETPLGTIPIDTAAHELLGAHSAVAIDDRPHAREHSLEVELPFLQTVLAEFSLVPLALGDASPGIVAELLELVWGGAETLVVVSTDLSHYLAYAEAARRDRETAGAIVALAADRIGDEDACGRVPLRGLLVTAKRRGLAAVEIDLRSSGDTAGGREEVVGYGAFALG